MDVSLIKESDIIHGWSLLMRPLEADPTSVNGPKGSGSVESSAGSNHGRERIGWALNIVAVAVALLAWVLFSSPRTSTTFPTPQDVFAAAKQITLRSYAGGTLVTHTLYSIKLALSGFFIAVAAAVPLGIAMALDRRIFAVVEPIVGVIRPIPPLAWVPIAIVWFGLGDAAMIFVVWFTAFVPSLINTYSGVCSVDPTLIAAARVHGAKGIRLLLEVIIPGALPMIFTGLRVSLQAAWMTLVAAELVGAFYGLGRVLSIAAQDIYPGMIVVAMGCIACAGALVNAVLNVLERAVSPWADTAT
jgi:taurine transport system permease protein